MDLLPYAVVDHLAHYLFRDDIAAIARIASDSVNLENWSSVAEDHLRQRYLLDVDVYIADLDEADKKTKGRTIQLSVMKRQFSGEAVEPWNFKKRIFAWIASVRIHAFPSDLLETHRPSSIEEVMRVISLPVATGVASSLRVEGFNPPEMDIALKMLKPVQKTFSKVGFYACENGFQLKVEDFVSAYVSQEAQLQYLYVGCTSNISKEQLAETVVSLLTKKRKTPLKVKIPTTFFGKREVDLFVEKWQQSDGSFETEKEFIWWACDDEWQNIDRQRKSAVRYIAHASRRSSLCLTRHGFSVVNFKLEHLRVNFEWIDSLIGDWKKGDGFYVHRTDWQIKLVLESLDEWQKLVSKHGPLARKGSSPVISIAHPANFVSLDLCRWNADRIGSRGGLLVELKVKHEKLSDLKLGELIVDWKDGCGDYVVNEQSKVEFALRRPSWDRLSNARSGQVVYNHPTADRRLLIKPLIECQSSLVVRAAVVGVDSEVVTKWNLHHLFGALSV